MISNHPSSKTGNHFAKAKLKNTLELMKTSFTLIGEKTGIRKPMANLAILSVLMTSLLFVAAVCFMSGTAIGFGVLCLVLLFLVLVPLRFFLRTYFKAVMSRITYQTVIGQPFRYADATRHTRSRAPGLLFIGLVDMLVAHTTNKASNRQGVTGMITSLVMSALAPVWDLLNHYMIPAVVIEEKPLKQCVPEIKELRHNVPAALTGVFGIDIVGSVMRNLLLIPTVVLLAAGVGLGYLIGSWFPGVSWEISGHTVSWLPPLVALYIAIVAGGILKAVVESIKAIYFTIFYTTVMHTDRIPEEYREQLTGYLMTGAEKAGVNPA